ncbi:MAG: peptidylprolyl isomerase [Polyangiaceae bacterium]
MADRPSIPPPATTAAHNPAADTDTDAVSDTDAAADTGAVDAGEPPTAADSGAPSDSAPRPESRARAFVRRALRERLVQFGLVAAVLFAVAPREEEPSRIELHHTTLEALHDAAAKKASVLTIAGSTEEVDRRAIEDEILFREGVRLGLDEGDGVIRQRVVQKTLFFAEELADATRPATEAELRAYFEAHSGDFVRPARVHALHVFSSTMESLPARPADDVGSAGSPPSLGAPGPVPPEIRGDQRRLAEAFGPEMARQVLELSQGTWHGPMKSAFGYHFVKILGREGEQLPRFEDVRARVAERESLARRKQATAGFIAKAAARYTISLDGEPVGTLSPSGRVAIRAAASGED